MKLIFLPHSMSQRWVERCFPLFTKKPTILNYTFSEFDKYALSKCKRPYIRMANRHFSLLNVNFAGACGYDFVCDGRRLVRAYLRRRRGAI